MFVKESCNKSFLRQCQVNFVFFDKGPPFFIANQQILKLKVTTGCILIFTLCRWLWRTARIRAGNVSVLNGFVPENARNELLIGAANNRSNFVPRGFAAAKSSLSLQRKAACKPENLQAAFQKVCTLLHPRSSQNQPDDHLPK